MAQLQPASTSRLFSISGTNYEADVVASSRGVLLSVTAKNYDTLGHMYRGNALAALSLSDAIRLRHLLDEAIAVAKDTPPAQPGIWFNATVSDVARRIG